LKYRTLFLIVLGLFTTNGAFSQSLSDKIKIKTDSLIIYQKITNRIKAEIEQYKLDQITLDINTIGLPKLEPSDQLIQHKAMALVYSEKHEQPKWVSHIITTDIRNGVQGRSNDFRTDPKIKTGSADEYDYFLKTINQDSSITYDGFGYDRGHLAPSADFRWSAEALSESFYYSNMSPMLADFNRDSWAKLEDLFRSYIYRNPDIQLYMVTGPVLTDDLPKIPRAQNNVTVPKQFFKVALDLTNNRAIAFLMPNAINTNPLESYAVSIDQIESLTGIDFFHQLPDDLESKMESINDPKPFLSKSEQTDVIPDHPTKLPRNTFNTIMAKGQMGNWRVIRVMGTVVSTKLSAKGNVFLNLDKQFPNQIFTVTIFKDQMTNFSYPPDKDLEGKKIIVTGKTTNFNGVPSMAIENEDDIEVVN
jgi:endonuclease G